MSTHLDNRGHKDRATLFRRFAEHLNDRSKEILRDGDAVTLGETLAFPEESAGRFAGLFEP